MLGDGPKGPHQSTHAECDRLMGNATPYMCFYSPSPSSLRAHIPKDLSVPFSQIPHLKPADLKELKFPQYEIWMVDEHVVLITSTMLSP